MFKDKIKLNYIFGKLVFPLEFILSLLISYVMLRFAIIRHYEYYNSLKHVILITILGLLILALIIYNCKKNKGKFENIVIGFLIPVGMMYLIFMMPSQVPDEQAHLRRAYEISEGVIIGRKDVNCTIPRDLRDKIKPYLETYSKLNENLAGRTDYNDKVEIKNSAETYPFVLYMFSSIGFIISRTFGLNILIGCYLGKLMNFIVFIISAYYVLKIIPFGKLPMAAVMFMPMFIHQATSTSADCLVNIITMIFVAFILHLRFKEEKITLKDGIFLVILGILIGISKYVYLPIIGLSLILIPSKNISKKYKIILILTLFILSTLAAGGYYIFTSSYQTSFSAYFKTNHINSSEQIKGIINNPLAYLKTLTHTLKNSNKLYLYQAIGNSLGWFSVNVPSIYITIYLFVMIDACFVEKNEISFNFWQKILSILIVISIVVLIITGMYITWTGVGNTLVEGVQGRYFIPIIGIALLCLCLKDNYVKVKNIEYKLPILLCLLNAPVLIAIHHTFMQ